jgi:spore coat polysaccharide biosynthesis predicted glycosyltransferase SpsG
MRCLTLGEALRDAGHEIALMGEISGVPWLEGYLDEIGVERIDVPRDSLRLEDVLAAGGDRVVVDSYWIEPAAIADVDRGVPTMAVIDNTTRGIVATWYLDHNLGAERRPWAVESGTVLAGSRYALVRRAVSRHRRDSGWRIPSEAPRVVAFMGGTDPGRVMTEVAGSIASAMPHVHLTVVTTPDQIEEVDARVAGMPHVTVLGPRLDLPEILGTADLIVSAAGTSAWDTCSMGRPVVLVGVVDNQSSGLEQALLEGVAVGVDATHEGASAVGELLARLCRDDELREGIVRRANEVFDCGGSSRVAAALIGTRAL